MNKTDLVEVSSLRADLPAFRPGDTVKVHVRVVEAGRERIQVFQGVVIRRQGGGLRETFTVRKISFGVGVERTFPVHSPSIAKLEVVTKGRVRRAKLYYLRERRGKRARIRERRDASAEGALAIDDAAAEDAAPDRGQEATPENIAAAEGIAAEGVAADGGGAADEVSGDGVSVSAAVDPAGVAGVVVPGEELEATSAEGQG